jgi:hypothetical protein
MPVTVPIVSKKSLSMTEKIVSRATIKLTLPNSTPYQSALLKVANDGAGLMSAGTLLTPTMRAMIVVAMMLRIRAALILSA